MLSSKYFLCFPFCGIVSKCVVKKYVSHASIFYHDFVKQNVMIQQHLSHVDSKLTNESYGDHYHYVHSGHPTT